MEETWKESSGKVWGSRFPETRLMKSAAGTLSRSWALVLLAKGDGARS